jgi:RHS repeat-associated protein
MHFHRTNINFFEFVPECFTGGERLNAILPGQYFDKETGLHYNYFRDYDPSTGRYVQSDPIGLAGGSFSTYGYVGGSPLSFIDPMGLTCVSVDGRMTCSVPGGPTFTVPSPEGQPKNLGPTDCFYHYTNVRRPLNGADPKCVMRELTQRPTPGKPNPASPGGTKNNAVPPYYPFNNSVKSYTTNGYGSGIPIVVNTAGVDDGSAFGPGYVARYVEDGYAYTKGEGTSTQQGLGPSDWANEQLWGKDLERIIEKCKCQK